MAVSLKLPSFTFDGETYAWGRGHEQKASKAQREVVMVIHREEHGYRPFTKGKDSLRHCIVIYFVLLGD